MLKHNTCLSSTTLFKIFTLCQILTTNGNYVNTYQKPNPSNERCILSIEAMEESLDRIQGTNKSQAICLGCTQQTRSNCAIELDSVKINCQGMIDSIYKSCEGVTLPRNYYFDPPVCFVKLEMVFLPSLFQPSDLSFVYVQENKIFGFWNSESIQRAMRIAAARCSCNSCSPAVLNVQVIRILLLISIPLLTF